MRLNNVSLICVEIVVSVIYRILLYSKIIICYNLLKACYYKLYYILYICSLYANLMSEAYHKAFSRAVNIEGI